MCHFDLFRTSVITLNFIYSYLHLGKAVLLDGECAARCIDDLHGKFFRGQRLSVSLASCDFMLCITQLPVSFTHNQFLSLLAPYGTTERCFLVHRFDKFI